MITSVNTASCPYLRLLLFILMACISSVIATGHDLAFATEELIRFMSTVE